ncbi:hypothetical protein ID866_8305 [Astraeus odoratus]|nr:hypothetical protein ID866_8305 [Astraeus odoratus]
MHNLHAECFLTPVGMRHISPSLVHLTHADALVQLLLAWTSESACCCFLASAAAATIHQHSYQSSHGQYMHLVLPSWLPTSALLLPPSVTSPPLSGIFLPLLPGASIWPLIMPLLLSVFMHCVPHTIFYIFPGPLCCPPNLCHQYWLPVLHLAPSSS